MTSSKWERASETSAKRGLGTEKGGQKVVVCSLRTNGVNFCHLGEKNPGRGAFPYVAIRAVGDEVATLGLKIL